MNMEMFITLVPLMLFWGIFMASQSLVTSLLALLLSSLALPLVYTETFKVFWPCGLLIILMSTGIMVIFAYIVSLHEGKSKLNMNNWLFLIGGFSLLTYAVSEAHTSAKQHLSILELVIEVDVMISLILIYILLFLVVTFVRLVYSKGGGFRKKF